MQDKLKSENSDLKSQIEQFSGKLAKMIPESELHLVQELRRNETIKMVSKKIINYM